MTNETRKKVILLGKAEDEDFRYTLETKLAGETGEAVIYYQAKCLDNLSVFNPMVYEEHYTVEQFGGVLSFYDDDGEYVGKRLLRCAIG